MKNRPLAVVLLLYIGHICLVNNLRTLPVGDPSTAQWFYEENPLSTDCHHSVGKAVSIHANSEAKEYINT